MPTLSCRDFNQDVSHAKREANSRPVVIADRGRRADVLMKAFTDVARIRRGQLIQPTAVRADMSGDMPGFPVFWNRKRG